MASADHPADLLAFVLPWWWSRLLRAGIGRRFTAGVLRRMASDLGEMDINDDHRPGTLREMADAIDPPEVAR